MNSVSGYIKTIFLSICLMFESYGITWLMVDLIKRQNYFSIDIPFSLRIIGMMVLSMYTFSLTIGAWDKWEQYVVIPLPVSIGIFTGIYNFNLNYAIILFFLTLLLMIYDIYLSSRIKDLLIKFDPKLILRFSTKGLLFIFSIIGGLVVIMQATASEINIGEKISEIAEKPIRNMVEKQFSEQMEKQLAPFGVTNLEEIDPSFLPVLEELGLPANIYETATNPSKFDMDIKKIVEEQVNTVIHPYQDMIHPIIAVLMFALFQLYAGIAHFLFMITVDLLFWVSKILKFYHVELVPVQQEKIKF